jgi:imidazolonepropionase-like amidohydrolase
VPTNVTFDYLAKEGASFGLPPQSVAKIEDVRSQGLAALQTLHDAGVMMGYGSDLLGEMHQHQSDEFILRGEVLPAIEVIRSATVNAAKVVKQEGKLGVVEAGAHADLIVVDGDPLKNLALLTGQGRHMPAIMRAGRFVKDELAA